MNHPVRYKKFLFQKNPKYFVKNKSFKNFAKNKKQRDWTIVFVCHFLMNRSDITFFHSDGKELLVKTWRNIIPKGLQMVSPHIFNMRILILSCPWALLSSRPWIIFPIYSAENVIEDNRLLVRKVRPVGSSLWLAKREHCSEKKQLKSSGFSLTSVTKQFL